MFWGSVLTGILSGILTIAVVEGCRLLIARYYRRALRQVLSAPSLPWAIVVGGVTASGGTVVGVKDIFAVSHTLEMLARAGIAAGVCTHDQLPVDAPRNLLCIGGPAVNRMTAHYLSQYCSGFVPSYSDRSGLFQDTPDGWTCGGERFYDSEKEAFGFLVKLNGPVTGNEGTVHLLFGRRAMGTAAAAYHLNRHWDRLYRRYQRSPFFAAIKATTLLGYKSVTLESADLTSSAIRERGGTSGLGE